MRFEVETEKTFIPTYKGNDKSDEPIEIVHRFPSPDERHKYIYTEDVQFTSSGEVLPMKYHQDQAGLTKALITSIRNLWVGGKEIKTAQDLYTTRGVPPMLITEIETHILMASPEVNSDFLSQPSPST